MLTTPPKDCPFQGNTFTFKLSVQKSCNRPLSGGDATSLGKITPPRTGSSHWKLSLLLNKKSSSTSSPPTPLGSSCRYSTLLLMLKKESQGGLPPGPLKLENWTLYIDVSLFCCTIYQDKKYLRENIPWSRKRFLAVPVSHSVGGS